MRVWTPEFTRGRLNVPPGRLDAPTKLIPGQLNVPPARLGVPMNDLVYPLNDLVYPLDGWVYPWTTWCIPWMTGRPLTPWTCESACGKYFKKLENVCCAVSRLHSSSRHCERCWGFAVRSQSERSACDLWSTEGTLTTAAATPRRIIRFSTLIHY